MNTRKPRALLWLLTVPAFVLILWAFQEIFFRIYVNQSSSIPEGVYRSIDKSVVEKGDTVAFRISGKAALIVKKYGITYNTLLFKKVVATSGDSVCWIDGSVSVNGSMVLSPPEPNSIGLLPHPDSCLSLKDGELVLGIPENPRSLDSRYFGVVTISDIEDVIVKL